MTETLERVSAECSLQDVAGACAIKQRAPLFQLANAFRRFLRMNLGHAPVVQKLAAAHRVAKMGAPIVGRIDIRHRRGDTAFGHDGVRFAEQRLADHADTRALPKRFDRRAQSRSAGADDQHIVFVSFELFVHSSLRSWIEPLATNRDVKISQTNRKQTQPGKQHVMLVEKT